MKTRGSRDKSWAAAFATSALSLSLLALHAMVSLARGGTHDVRVLRKGTGAVTLGGTVERAQLLLPFDNVRSSHATGPRAGRVPTTAKILTTKPPIPYRRLSGPYCQNTPLLESAESRMSADSFNRQPIPVG